MGLLTVKASGQSLTVDIQTTGAHEAATFSDEALTTPITLPLAITTDQDFYFRPGEAVVNVTVTTAAGVVLVNAEQHVVGTVDHVVLTPLPTPAQEATTDSTPSGGSTPVMDYCGYLVGAFTVISGGWRSVPLFVAAGGNATGTQLAPSPDGATSIVAPHDGIYTLTADAFPTSDPAAIGSLHVAAVIDDDNTSTTVTSSVPISPGMSLSPAVFASPGCTFYCPAGNHIKILARQDTGSNLDIIGNAQLVYLGPGLPQS